MVRVTRSYISRAIAFLLSIIGLATALLAIYSIVLHHSPNDLPVCMLQWHCSIGGIGNTMAREELIRRQQIGILGTDESAFLFKLLHNCLPNELVFTTRSCWPNGSDVSLLLQHQHFTLYNGEPEARAAIDQFSPFTIGLYVNDNTNQVMLNTVGGKFLVPFHYLSYQVHVLVSDKHHVLFSSKIEIPSYEFCDVVLRPSTKAEAESIRRAISVTIVDVPQESPHIIVSCESLHDPQYHDHALAGSFYLVRHDGEQTLLGKAVLSHHCGSVIVFDMPPSLTTRVKTLPLTYHVHFEPDSTIAIHDYQARYYINSPQDIKLDLPTP